MAMDVMRYIELKEKKAVRVMAAGKAHFAIAVRRFDGSSGMELEPEIERITREGVKAARTSFEEGVASCDLLLKDMDGAEAAAAGDESQ